MDLDPSRMTMPLDVVPSQTDTLAAARAGSSDALGRLFASHANVVYRVALRLTASDADAQDIVQDVFIGLPEALRGYHEQGAFEPWLKRIAVRCALMRMRGAERRDARHERLATEADPHVAAPDIGTRLTLADAIDRLSPALRTVFVLHDVEGYGHDEIARLLGVRAGTSQVRLFRARALLRAALEA
jgi:RNA polymerase sigma-70 factor, ECF subfamily